MNMSVKIAGVEFKNPVMEASGTFGSGMEYSEFVDLSRLGAVVTKVWQMCRGRETRHQGSQRPTAHDQCHWSAEPGYRCICKERYPIFKEI